MSARLVMPTIVGLSETYGHPTWRPAAAAVMSAAKFASPKKIVTQTCL